MVGTFRSIVYIERHPLYKYASQGSAMKWRMAGGGRICSALDLYPITSPASA